MHAVSNRISPWFLLLVAATAVGGVLAVLGTPEAETTGSSVLLTAGVVVLVLAGWAVSLCLHEFAHAYTAYRAGDRSVAGKGYLTLDFRRYTDIGLSFVLPVIFLLLGGIPLPGGAVWINHGAIRSRPLLTVVSLAGPLTNLLIGVLCTAAVAVVPMPIGLAIALSCLALIQVLAFVLNILPVPGLDGFGAIEPYLPAEVRRAADRFRPWGPIVLFLLLIGVPGASQLFFDAGSAVFALVGGNLPMASTGYGELFFWQGSLA